MIQKNFIRWFETLSLEDVALVGGKNASLSELYRDLTAQGVPVPNGFAITAKAYRYVLDQAGLWDDLHQALDGLNTDNTRELGIKGKHCRKLIYSANIPQQLESEILTAYSKLENDHEGKLSVAVRSSATAEDLPNASFAGQHDSYLNLSGADSLLDACRRCFASLFTDRAIRYRSDNGYGHFDVSLSIGVMKMVRSDIGSSGVMFTLDTDSGFRDVVFITSAYGLGETVVQGQVETDEFYVHKPTFNKGIREVLSHRLGQKKIRMVYDVEKKGPRTTIVPTPIKMQEIFSINDRDIMMLADFAIKIEDHYSTKIKESRPMDIEWAKDGLNGQLYIVQARPETVVSQTRKDIVKEYTLNGGGNLLVTGRAVGGKIQSGVVRIIQNLNQLTEFKEGEILVADTTSPDWVAVMKKAAAIVTNRGGRTCHASIVARELGIPAVVGTGDATSILKDGQKITVSCASGASGTVYRGYIPFQVQETNLNQLARPRTKIMVNLGDPEQAFTTAMIPNDGVGLSRLEFIISESVKAHPMALLYPERVGDQKTREIIGRLTQQYASGKDYFVEKLSEGIAMIAAGFYPKPVIVRMSDFKTNEYANLIGGDCFEPKEENPMLGFRGASRYIHPDYRQGFALECADLKRVREKMGFSNIKLMIPFCRRVSEAEKVLEALAEYGLIRGQDGLEVYMMCEIPNNILQIDVFCKLFDGISIGSNDLTQLVLGVDRDSEKVAFDFDERDPGVMEMIRLAIDGARRNHRHCGICGQAPSDYPEIAEFLVRQGIESISLSPDAVLSTTKQVLQIEADLNRQSSCTA